LSTTFTIEALNLYDAINIKGIRSLLSGRVITSNPQELHLQYGENSYLFVYRFGCLVFFNVPKDEKEREISKVKAALGEGLPNPTSEAYQINVGDFPTKVEFEYVELKKPSLDFLRLIAMTVGQSAALEYFEIRTERMLYDTSSFMQDLAQGRTLPMRVTKLLQIIGSTASTRQHIISNVSILDPPEETWKSKELGKLYSDIQENFDIGMRFRIMDRKLTLIQDNIEILTDLISSRKATLLEALVVLLIVFEIGLAIVTKI
jgi:required for meiotic nuclear division protein 1